MTRHWQGEEQTQQPRSGGVRRGQPPDRVGSPGGRHGARPASPTDHAVG